MTRPHRKTDARVTGIEGNTADGAGPVRQCAVTRERLTQDEMVRFALSPEGVVTPDISAKLPGRGVWVKAERAAVETAVKKGAFSRGFKSEAKAPDTLADDVERLLLMRSRRKGHR